MPDLADVVVVLIVAGVCTFDIINLFLQLRFQLRVVQVCGCDLCIISRPGACGDSG